MKPQHQPTTSRLLMCLAVALTLLAAPAVSMAKIFDSGIDPYNTGKGDHVYYLAYCTNQLGGNVPSVTDLPSFLAYEKSQGVDYLVVKAGTGSTNFNGTGSTPQVNWDLLREARKVGIKIIAYTRSFGDDIPGEAALADYYLSIGCDAFEIDAESEWESTRQGTNGPAKAWQLCSTIKTNWPNKYLCHAPFPYISYHSSFPYKEFGYWCDAVLPQDYWYSIGVTPTQMVYDMDKEYRAWQNGLTGIYTNAIKPLAPIGQADTVAQNAAEITEFVNALKNDKGAVTAGGYRGVSYWRADLHTAAMWEAIRTNNIGSPMGTVNDIIWDNTNAIYTGTWATAASATDKYHADYRYKSVGSNASYVTFKPALPVTGTYQVYEWHPQGSNRASNVAHRVAYNGGLATNFVNQKVNGGQWNLLGTYPFKAGPAGYVRVMDGSTEPSVSAFADAIKWVYVPPAAPAAPSGLIATSQSTTNITLSWADNSSNEDAFIIMRSTSSGGPYTNLYIVSDGVTTYNDRFCNSATTYYYVVKARNPGGESALCAQASATTGTAIADIIVDNTQAAVTGSWTTGTSAADKYGADYRYKGPGTGTAYLIFTPNVVVPGEYKVFEWHPAGSNRASNAPVEIFYNGGSYTKLINQQVSGGQWVLCGQFNFAAGTGGYIKISDNFVGTGLNIMADAIRLEFIQSTQTPPTAPSGLAAAAVSSSQINLSWTDNSNNEDNFIVSRSTTSGGPYTDIVTLGANVTSYSNTGLSASTTYYYVVRAANAAGSSAFSAQASATTQPPAPPAAPSGLSATAASSSQINLSWTDNSSDETGFRVERSTDGVNFAQFVSLSANVTSTSDSGLTANTLYYYRVRAYNAGGNSAYSAVANATTLDNPPAAPSGLSATAVSDTQINLAWADNSANETSFIVARSTTSGGPYSDLVTLGANVTSYNNTGLSASTTYYYVVRAANAAGSSANSAQASATTQAPPPPAAPSGLAATAVSSSQINLSWTDNSANETSFIVARSTTSGGPYSDLVTLGANVTSYNNTGLAENTTYYYVVRAANAGGSSANSAQASATTPLSIPTAPSGLSATAVSSSQINLAWTDNSGNEASFIVARSTTSGGPYTDLITLGANVTSYNNTGLSAGTTYYYVVRASNAAGSSANSAQASATTLANIPAAPSGLAATPVRATQVNLAWTDNSSDENNFIVARGTVSGGPYTDIATLAANTVSYSNTGLAANTTYYYVVRASNGGGSSANSAQAVATTYETDLIIDNKSATLTGAWTPGTMATDKYGSDYVSNGPGAGSEQAKYTPYIATAGIYEVYEWHSVGANRATDARHFVQYNGGSTTVQVNQQVNGGQWNLIGSFNFAAGSAGYVAITDGHVTNTVIADAIKLVLSPTPTAPSGLTATAVSGSQINLSWTDNSANELNFIVARSTSAGGPYTDIATLGANVTSYSNTGLAANTTYYYVVRASNGSGSSLNSNEANAKTYKKAHVHSITMSWVVSGTRYKSRAVVNVKDSAGVNVASATVTGNFTGTFINNGLSGVSDASGNATITSTSTLKTGTITFTVTNITGTSLQYDSAANVVSSATHSR